MNDNMKIIMAGMFSMTNIGLPRPTVDEVAMAVKHPPKSAADSVCMLAQQYIESEKMLEMFVDEAESWVGILGDYGEAKCREIWPEHWELYDQAVVQATQGVN